MKKLAKKLAFLSAVLGFSSPLLAAEGDGINTVVSQKLGTWLSTMNTNITSFFSENLDSILSIIGIAAGLMLVWIVFKMFRKGANKIG